MTTKITSVDQIENIKEVPTKHLKYAENFVKVGQWNGLEANIIGGGLCLGMSSNPIVTGGKGYCEGCAREYSGTR